MPTGQQEGQHKQGGAEIALNDSNTAQDDDNNR
jgi:hypothetical protein